MTKILLCQINMGQDNSVLSATSLFGSSCRSGQTEDYSKRSCCFCCSHTELSCSPRCDNLSLPKSQRQASSTVIVDTYRCSIGGLSIMPRERGSCDRFCTLYDAFKFVMCAAPSLYNLATAVANKAEDKFKNGTSGICTRLKLCSSQ